MCWNVNIALSSDVNIALSSDVNIALSSELLERFEYIAKFVWSLVMALKSYSLLTHLPLNKMAAILADDIFKYIFLNKNFRISIKISLKFVPKVPLDNKSVLVQVMAWRRTGDKPLPKPMLTQFTDVYMRH